MIVLYNKFISDDETIYNGLTKVYGINYATSKLICSALGITLTTTFDILNSYEHERLQDYIVENSGLHMEDLLKKEQALYFKKLKELHSYKTLRHIYKLPVHGQRTRSNRKTSRKINMYHSYAL